MTSIRFILMSTIVLLFSCKLNSASTVSSTESSTQLALESPPQVALAGLVPYERQQFDPQLQDSELFRVELEASDPRAPIEKWPAGHVYQLAAEYYAALHDDYDVTVGELLSAGLWPYETTPLDADMDARIHSSIPRTTFSKRLLENKSSLLLRGRRVILKYILNELYGHEATLPLQSPDKLIRDERFWQNPLLGIPMQESPSVGDYTLYPIDSLPDYGRFVGAEWLDQSWRFPAINMFDVTKSKQIQGSYVRNASEIEWCCFLFIDTVTVQQHTNHCIPLSCVCGETPIFCNLCLKYDDEWDHIDYTFVLASCDTPPEGYDEVYDENDCPVTRQDSMGAPGAIPYDITHNCRVCAYTADADCNAMWDFINLMTGPNPPHGVTVFGPVLYCDCS